MANRTKRTNKKVTRFLDALSETANVSKAAEAAGIARRTVYEWREADEQFAEKWDDAVDVAADRLEEEARRRAMEGTDEPVFYQGSECGTIRRYSDTLLIFLLKGARPEKYRERYEHTVEPKGVGALTIVIEDRTKQDTEPA